MSSSSSIIRKRIEAQGFRGLDDKTIASINYWLRLSPFICAVWTAIGTANSSASLLWLSVPFVLAGVFFSVHPFDAIYNFGLRVLIKSVYLPRYGKPRRFACLLAALMIGSAALSFQTGHIIAGNIFGWCVVIAAAVNVTIGFCIPSFIYGLLFGKPIGCKSTSLRIMTRNATTLINSK